ncbi:AraC family transcriptional regulator [Flavitalea sp.]|nr:AraC family transcriptional regulator [Flavitalea sp.]
MINYFKYLPTSSEDESWGLHVLNAGCNRINKNVCYPSPDHPAHHYFNWSKGRVLDEYQIIYISKGEGSFESIKCPEQPVKEGSIILLFPGEWHRFKPGTTTGWDEYWVGFKGTIIDNIAPNFFSKENAVLEVGLHEIIVQLFDEIIEKTKEERTGYQPLIAGIVMHLLGEIHSFNKQQQFPGEDITASVIKKAGIIFRTNVESDLSMEQVAEQLNVSYAWFRKAFKNYTGIAPHKYLLQLKIEKAKLLLSDQSISIKDVAFRLNFESAFYFSRLFKEKTGVSPELYRKNL